MVLTEGTLVKYNGIVLSVGHHYYEDEDGPEAYDLLWPGSDEYYEYEVEATLIDFYKNKEDAVKTPSPEEILELISDNILNQGKNISIEESSQFSGDDGPGITVSGLGPDGYWYSATIRIDKIWESTP